MADSKLKAAFVAGWMQGVGNREPDKAKLSEIASAAADKWLSTQANTKEIDPDQQGIDFNPSSDAN